MITLHIEDTKIRLMVVNDGQVEKVATLPLEPGLVENGVIKDNTAVSGHITELLTAQNISDRQVVASISGIHSIYRTVSSPHLSKGLIAEAVHHEFERLMPVPLAELYTSWQAVDVSAEEIVFCLVGLPRNTVDSTMETLRQAELQSVGLDIKPLALARVTDEKDALIINVQPLSFDIVIMQNGIPELLRSIIFPSGDLGPADKVALIKEEMDRTVTFYHSSHKETPITAGIATFISGEMREMLSSSLGYNTKPLPDLLPSRVDFDISDYVINIGLALKKLKDIRTLLQVNIDATPDIYRSKPRSKAAVLSWVALVLAIAILVTLVIVTQRTIAETTALMTKIDDMAVQSKDRQAAEALLKMLQAKMDAVKAAQNFSQAPLGVLKSQHAKVNGDLARITSLMPGTINLTSISYGDKVVLNGTAPDKATILNYARALRDSGRFSNVIMSDMHEIEYNQWSFILLLE